MRLRLAHIALCTWFLSGQQLIHAQEQPSDESSDHSVPCLSALSHDEPRSAPEISISDVTFSGFIQMPLPYQEEVVSSIKQQRYAYPLDGVVEEALERVKAGWQNHGYFKAEVSGDAKTLATSATSIHLALFVHVEENAQYRLGEITLRNNRAIPDSAKLRDLFPIKDGEIFSREKIAEGLENLRKVYGEYGYINYIGVSSTTFDEEKKLAHLAVDVDEGKQFLVSGINVEGVDQTTQQKVLKDLLVKPGQIYNSRLWQLSLLKFTSLFPNCACRLPEPLRLDERTGTVAITLDFRSCSAD